MGLSTYNDGAYQTFQEAVAGALTGKEGYLVERGATAGTVQLVTRPGNEIGVVHQKLRGAERDVTVRLLGAAGIARFVAGGVIAHGAAFAAAVGGKVIAAKHGDRVLGTRQSSGAAADGDVFEGLVDPGFSHDGRLQFFAEPSANAFADKVGYLVQLGSAAGTAALLTTGLAIGAIHTLVTGGAMVRMLGHGGTVRLVAGGVIAKAARVAGASGGKVVAAAAAGRSVGISLNQANTADNDPIDVIDVIETLPA